MSIESQTLLDRVDALEKRNRAMKRTFVILTTVGVTLFMLHTVRPTTPTARAAEAEVRDVVKILRAQAFELIDSNGACRARLSLTREGYDENAPALAFFTPEGKKVTELAGYGKKQVGNRTYFCYPGLALSHPDRKSDCAINAEELRMSAEVDGKDRVIELRPGWSSPGLRFRVEGSESTSHLNHLGLTLRDSKRNRRMSLSSSGLACEAAKTGRQVWLNPSTGLSMLDTGKDRESHLGVRIQEEESGQEVWLGTDRGLFRSTATEPPERTTNTFYKLRVMDLGGTLIAQGTLSFPTGVQKGQTFKGRCQLNILPPEGGRAPAVACLAGHDGTLSGIVYRRNRISINIHPFAVDNMVFLRGQFDDETIVGECSFWSFRGRDIFGSFEATPLVFEDSQDKSQ